MITTLGLSWSRCGITTSLNPILIPLNLLVRLVLYSLHLPCSLLQHPLDRSVAETRRELLEAERAALTSSFVVDTGATLSVSSFIALGFELEDTQ